MDQNIEEKKEIRTYEMAVLIHPDLSEQDAQAHYQSLGKKIEEFDGKKTSEGPLNRMKLAYPIEKETNGYFGFIQFTAPSSALDSLSKHLSFDENLLRYMTIRRTVGSSARPKRKRISDRKQHTDSKKTPSSASRSSSSGRIDNEELEKKLEEILQ